MVNGGLVGILYTHVCCHKGIRIRLHDAIDLATSTCRADIVDATTSPSDRSWSHSPTENDAGHEQGETDEADARDDINDDQFLGFQSAEQTAGDPTAGDDAATAQIVGAQSKKKVVVEAHWRTSIHKNQDVSLRRLESIALVLCLDPETVLFLGIIKNILYNIFPRNPGLES